MNQVTLQFHCFIHKTAVIIEIMVAAVGHMYWFYLQNGRGNQYVNGLLMIFGGWLTRKFASLWRPVPACGARLGIPQTP